MRIVFDIDNTICITNGKDYINSIPNKEIITYINKLFDEGHTIIFHTARGYGDLNGNLSNIYSKWYSFTINQLKSWGVKFNELVLGKPRGDIYVDDRGFRFCVEDDVKKFDGLISGLNV